MQYFAIPNKLMKQNRTFKTIKSFLVQLKH